MDELFLLRRISAKCKVHNGNRVNGLQFKIPVPDFCLLLNSKSAVVEAAVFEIFLFYFLQVVYCGTLHVVYFCPTCTIAKSFLHTHVALQCGKLKFMYFSTINDNSCHHIVDAIMISNYNCE